MTTDAARKLTIRTYAEIFGLAYAEARTRLSRLAKIPAEPMPIVPGEDDDPGPWDKYNLVDLIAMDWDGDGEFRFGNGPYGGEDVQHDNTRRAGFALVALAAYNARVAGDQETQLVDLFSDMRHLCDALGLDFEELVSTSARHHGPETRGEF